MKIRKSNRASRSKACLLNTNYEVSYTDTFTITVGVGADPDDTRYDKHGYIEVLKLGSISPTKYIKHNVRVIEIAYKAYYFGIYKGYWSVVNLESSDINDFPDKVKIIFNGKSEIATIDKGTLLPGTLLLAENFFQEFYNQEGKQFIVKIEIVE